MTVGRGVGGVSAGSQADAGDAGLTAPGALVGEDYRVDRVLGEGGMGVVVAARDVRSGERVAIKLIHPARGGERTFVKRFMREARITLQLKGPHVARVMRLGQLDSGLPYLVMEYLDGLTLDELLAERGALPIETAVDYLLQACDAVAEAHALGVVHRDLKPGNLFVANGPGGAATIKVIDFGISKWTAGRPELEEAPMTTTAGPIGSPRYMSPEQLSEVAVADPRSDVWALGVILFELLTGRHPFEGESLANLYVRILRDEVPSLRTINPALPAGLDAVYRRCLTKERAARLPSVHDLVIALAPFASVAGRELARQIAARAPASATTIGAFVRAPEHRRTRWIAMGVGLACAGGIYFGVWPLVSKKISPPAGVVRPNEGTRVEMRVVPTVAPLPAAAAIAPAAAVPVPAAPAAVALPAARAETGAPAVARVHPRPRSLTSHPARARGAAARSATVPSGPPGGAADREQDLFGTRH